MFLPDLSIRRPVLTTVVTLAILLVGWVAYRELPVRELPDVDYPIVSVRTILPGASPEVVETEVTEVLEEELNTIEGIDTLTSVSGEQTSIITAEFELDRDIDVALQDVRDKISRVRGELPSDVEEPVVEKQDPEASPIIWLTLRNPDLPLIQVNDFADNVVKERIQTLPGVGSIILGGEKRFAVRVRLDPQRMAGYDLTVAEVARALARGNVEIPSGRIESESREFTIKTEGELPTPESFNDLIVAWRDGSPIRLGEIGIAEAGVENERSLARFNSEPTVGLGVIKQSDANTVAVADAVLAEVEQIRRELPPGYTLAVAVDDSEFIERSVHEVEETLLIAFGLVILVIWFFLRSARATLIPALAIPVSIVGTFAAMWALGFSINTLTLLALVLAIGIVVDDAIVVLENVYRHMEEGEDRETAAREGTSEIAFAVIAISLALVIVFLPIAFVTGVVGRLFREFGISVAVAVLISAWVALTLTPMLCSRFLRREPHGEEENALLRAFEGIVAGATRIYEGHLRWALRHRWVVVLAAVASVAVTVLAVDRMGQEFTPPEDRGAFLAIVNAPEGATLEYTDGYLRQVEQAIRTTEGVDRYFSAIGLGIGGPATVSSGIVFTRMEAEREVSVFQAMNEVRRKVADLAGVDVFVIAPSAFNTGGFEKPLQFVIQATELDDLAEASDRMLARMRETPGLSGADADLDLNKPELAVTIDRSRAASLGVGVEEVATALQVLFGGQDVTKFKRGNERYDVIVQLQDLYRDTPARVGQVYVRGEGGPDGRGNLVQLSSVVTVQEGVGPSQINHYNRRRSVILDANLEGIPLGQGLARVRAIAADVLPPGFTTAVAGESQDFEESGASLLFSLVMAVVAIYLVLAGQFESFLHPLTIMLALPLALFGAVVSLAALGMTLNIYSFIGIIMLMGLVTKNSILLVDYTNTLRRRGVERREAVVRGAVVRLRPILMTSIAIVFGVLPIALALGAGAESRRPLGVAVVGGMIASTALTLFVVPVFYTLFEGAVDRVKGWRGRRVPETAALIALLLLPALPAAGRQAGAGTAPATTPETQAPETQAPETQAPETGAERDRLVLPGEAGVTVRLTLEEAVARALETNEEVRLAVADRELAAARLAEVRSALRPDVDFDLDYVRNLEQPVFFLQQGGRVQEIQVGSDNEYDLALTLSQPLFDARLFSAARAAELARQAAAEGISDRRTTVALLTRLAWYDVVLAGEQVAVQRAALEQAEDRLDQVRELFEAGTAAEFDLLTAEVEVDNIRPDLIAAENRLRLGRERLKRIVGLPPGPDVHLAGGFAEVVPAPSLEQALEVAFATRSDLRALELAVAAQEQRVQRERRTHLPRVDLSAEVRRQASTDQTLPDDLVQSSNAQLQVTVPLFQGGTRKARIAQEEAALSTARLLLEQRLADVRLDVQQALLALRDARQAIEASESNVRRAERALEIAQVRFANGLSTQVELNDAELATTRARLNYAVARYGWSEAWARLQAALGRAGGGGWVRESSPQP